MLIYLEIGQLTYATTNNKMHLDGPPVFSRFLMQDNKGIGSFLFCSCKDGTCLLLFNQKYTHMIAHVKYLLEKKKCAKHLSLSYCNICV